MATTCRNYPLPNVSSRRGAPMGRGDTLPDDRAAPVRLSLVEMKMVDGDYDTGGAYWGGWVSYAGGMFRAVGESGDTVVEVFTRALSRDAAKANIRGILPRATFYR